MIKNIHAKNPDATIDHTAKSVGIINQVCETLEDENHSLNYQVDIADQHLLKTLIKWYENLTFSITVTKGTLIVITMQRTFCSFPQQSN